MASYDSDSSGGAENYYTETNVLLGYASKEASDDRVSHLGGRPEWLDPSGPPTAALAKCKVCKDLMVLLLQLNGNLPEIFPRHERRLYVLSCRRQTCRHKEGSVRALRGVRVSEAAKVEKKMMKTESESGRRPTNPSLNGGQYLFGAKPSSVSSPVNPFLMGTITSTSSTTLPTSTSSNPFAAARQPISESAVTPPKIPHNSPDTIDLPKTFASALMLNSEIIKECGPPTSVEPWPEEPSHPPAYPLFYLTDADYETLDKVEDVAIPKTTMDLDEPGPSDRHHNEDKDIYESTMDKTFQKFADRLAQNPEQVIRYEFKGQPLLYSKTDAVGKLLSEGSGREAGAKAKVNGSGNRIPRCANCGAARVFEVQLTPHAIMELESEEAGIDGMEWGTIIVAVCERDCQAQGVDHGVGYVEEWAGVQWEELSERRR